MGKAKEKTLVKLPKADEVAEAKPLVEKVARARTRFAKISETAKPSDPKRRRARRHVKRAQRKLRRALAYSIARKKPEVAAAAAEAPAAQPAS
jgi:hypothetical protein